MEGQTIIPGRHLHPMLRHHRRCCLSDEAKTLKAEIQRLVRQNADRQRQVQPALNFSNSESEQDFIDKIFTAYSQADEIGNGDSRK